MTGIRKRRCWMAAHSTTKMQKAKGRVPAKQKNTESLKSPSLRKLKNRLIPSEACCCMLLQIVSEGRLVKMSWSVGTAGGGRAGLAVAASFPPEAPAACSVSEGGGDLGLDLKGFHAALDEAAAGAGPLSVGPLPSAFSSGVSLVATGDCTKSGISYYYYCFILSILLLCYSHLVTEPHWEYFGRR